VYSPSWEPSAFSIHDAAVAEALNPSNIRTWPSNLSTFRDKDGKIISFHGQDNQITCFNTERFYNHLSRSMQASSSELDHFFRLFRVSGMFHCNSGPGAWVIGQGGGLVAEGVPFDRKRNVLAALVEWVEGYAPPETIEGTKFLNDTVELGVAFRQQHCR
jgi:feruloyl esterase